MTFLKNMLLNGRHIVPYGLILALLVFLLKWLQWKFLIIDNSLDIYIGLIAIFFTILGVWVATQIVKRKTKTVIVEKEIYVPLPDDSANRSYYFLPDSVGTINYYGNDLPLNNGGGAEELAQFLKNQVLPATMKEYNVDQNRIGLLGFSMGGLFAAWHLVNYLGYFSDYVIIAPPLDNPFIGEEFIFAFNRLKNTGFKRLTKVYVAYAEHDLGYVRRGAVQWIEEWKTFDDENLRFLGEELKGFRHDSGAIPATINGYSFLYGKQR